MNDEKPALKNDLTHAARGLLMGSADIVPGVSGGTVALILGIYERLVTAVSHFDRTLLSHLMRREWKAAACHIDLRFLLALGCGIAVGIVSLAKLMNALLTQDETRPLALAVFFGLVAASIFLVARMISVHKTSDVARSVVLSAVGAALAYGLTGLSPIVVEPSLGYAFFCGLIAICAMILPGISGSFILLILGMYVYVTGIIGRAPTLNITVDEGLTLVVFSAGCAIGLATFSKLLRWLLARYEPQTMAVLCGFMIGSLRKIWPFRRETTLDHLEATGLSQAEIDGIQIASPEMQTDLLQRISLGKRHFENIWPEAWSSDVAMALAAGVVAAALVLLLDRITRGRTHTNTSAG